jgi:hypothetical protein
VYKSSKRTVIRIGIASLSLLLAVASFQSGATAATAGPAAPAGDGYTEIETYVDWVYLTLLGREPDPEGFAFWTMYVENEGALNFVHIAAGSQEWREARVREFYARWLDRPVDDAGLDHWATFLLGRNFAAFESFIGGSDEAYAHSGGTDAGYIDHVYRIATSRAPTEDEIAEGLELLSTGAPRSDFVQRVLLHGDGLTGRVRYTYQLTLGRDPDPAGNAYWKAIYQNTGNWGGMFADMMASPEAWEYAVRYR